MPEAKPERKTKQRDAIKSAIERAGVPISPKEILEAAQSHVAGLGLATVYRTLKILADAGVLAHTVLSDAGVVTADEVVTADDRP